MREHVQSSNRRFPRRGRLFGDKKIIHPLPSTQGWIIFFPTLTGSKIPYLMILSNKENLGTTACKGPISATNHQWG